MCKDGKTVWNLEPGQLYRRCIVLVVIQALPRFYNVSGVAPLRVMV